MMLSTMFIGGLFFPLWYNPLKIPFLKNASIIELTLNVGLVEKKRKNMTQINVLNITKIEKSSCFVML
jgi:hypothetical protein